MAHLHLQIEFGSDFEGYAAGFTPPPPPPPLLILLTPLPHLLSFWPAAIHGTLCRFLSRVGPIMLGGVERRNVRYAFDLISGRLKLDIVA